MVPGMGHCGGGDGHRHVRHAGRARTVGGEEAGAGVDSGLAGGARGKADRTRPLCAYPQVATYKGSGSTDEASNFVCK